MKTFVFLGLTFGWSIMIGTLLYLTGIPVDSPIGPLIFSVFLMPSPAIATCIVHRFRWREIAETYGLNVKRLNVLLIISSTLTFIVSFGLLYLLLVFLLGNVLHWPGVGSAVFSPEAVREQLNRSAKGGMSASMPLPPVAILFVLSFISPIIAGFTINGLVAFGEEMGWRGFLWQQLRPYGVKGKISLGVIWGLWHTPVILLGYNFPLHPYLGILMMVLFTVCLTLPLTDQSDTTESVYAPSITHGMINASNSFSLFVAGGTGLIGSTIGLVGCAAVLGAWAVTRWIMGRRRVAV
jgi:membrane protease YdiL (CAAX protease family)